ncbi:MAG: pentapeptide repeat-containing protein [Tabrizicola sp.]|nr:pentapeptide repeat-containing protein [Tabrizicola sp.]
MCPTSVEPAFNADGSPSDCPPGLWQAGQLRLCEASEAFVLKRLADHRDEPLHKALWGLEGLFLTLFQNLNFSGSSFRDHVLKGMVFAGARFDGATFHGARISGADFGRAGVRRDALQQAEDWIEAVVDGFQRAPERGARDWPVPLLGPWASFSEAHHLPELVLLPSDLDVTGLAEDLEEALREGRLAMGARPICTLDLVLLRPAAEAVQLISEMLGRDRDGTAGGSSMELVECTLRDALGYVDGLNLRLGRITEKRYDLPPPSLLVAIRRAKPDTPAFVAQTWHEFALTDDGHPLVVDADGHTTHSEVEPT